MRQVLIFLIFITIIIGVYFFVKGLNAYFNRKRFDAVKLQALEDEKIVETLSDADVKRAKRARQQRKNLEKQIQGLDDSQQKQGDKNGKQ